MGRPSRRFASKSSLTAYVRRRDSAPRPARSGRSRASPARARPAWRDRRSRRRLRANIGRSFAPSPIATAMPASASVSRSARSAAAFAAASTIVALDASGEPAVARSRARWTACGRGRARLCRRSVKNVKPPETRSDFAPAAVKAVEHALCARRQPQPLVVDASERRRRAARRAAPRGASGSRGSRSRRASRAAVIARPAA